MTTVGPNCLAITRHIQPGQDLQSLLELIAGDNRLSVSELLSGLGDAAPTSPYGLVSKPVLNFDALANALSLDPASLKMTTFAAFPHEAALSTRLKYTESKPRRNDVELTRHYRRTGARFCPLCLVERQGAWKTKWFLPMSVACTRHLVLLIDACPTCGRTPHSGEYRNTVAPARATQCLHPQPDSAAAKPTGRIQRCFTDLTSAQPTALEHSHPVIATQRYIDKALDGCRRDIRIPACGLDVPASAVLNALVRIVTWLSMKHVDLNLAVSSHIARGRRITTALNYRVRDHGKGLGPIYQPQLYAKEYSSLLCAATDVLHAPSLESAAQTLERYEDLTDSSPRVGGKNKYVRAMPRHQDRSDAALASAIRLVQAREKMKISDALSHRMYSPLPRKPRKPDQPLTWPHPSTVRHALETEHLPQSLWSSEMAALPRLTVRNTGVEAISASLVLARTGTFTRWSEFAARFHLPASSARTINVHLQRLDAADALDEHLTLLDQLWERLIVSPPPINYDRRRWEFRRFPSIDQQLAKDLDEQGISRTRTNHRFITAQLWELLTGGDARYCLLDQSLKPGRERTEYRSFLNRHCPALDEALHSAASRQLAERGIDEPVRWEPPEHNPVPPQCIGTGSEPAVSPDPSYGPPPPAAADSEVCRFFDYAKFYRGLTTWNVVDSLCRSSADDLLSLSPEDLYNDEHWDPLGGEVVARLLASNLAHMHVSADTVTILDHAFHPHFNLFDRFHDALRMSFGTSCADGVSALFDEPENATA